MTEPWSKSTAHRHRVIVLEFDRRHVPKTGLQPFCVGDVADQASQVLRRVVERLIAGQVHLLPLPRLKATLGFGMVVRVAHRRHPDRCPRLLEPGAGGRTRLLDPAIGVVDQSRRRPAPRHRLIQRRPRHGRVNRPRERPPDAAPRPGSEHAGKLGNGRRQADGRDIRHPRLTRAGGRQVGQQVRIRPQRMRRVSRPDEPTLKLAQQRLLSHHPEHALVGDGPPLTLERLRNPSIAIPGEHKHDPFDRVAQRCVTRVARVRRGMGGPPGAASADQGPELPDRPVGIGRVRRGDQRVPLRDGRVLSPFLRAAFSRASGPQTRSRSATLRSKATVLVASCGPKAASPRSATSCRQRTRRPSANPCSRPTCAGHFAPLPTSSTAASVTSRLHGRPRDIAHSSVWRPDSRQFSEGDVGTGSLFGVHSREHCTTTSIDNK